MSSKDGIEDDIDEDVDINANYRYQGPDDGMNMQFPQYQHHVAQYLWLNGGFAEVEAQEMVIKYANIVKNAYKMGSDIYHAAQAICKTLSGG